MAQTQKRALPKPRPKTTPPTARVRATRDWYPTRQAAAMIGVSEWSLRRRFGAPGWQQGVHYRWVQRQTRQTIEVNVPSVIALMNEGGWG